jgi:hypothetical protein
MAGHDAINPPKGRLRARSVVVSPFRSIRAPARLVRLAGDRPGVRHRTHVPELVGVAHRADRLDPPVEYVERPGKEHLSTAGRVLVNVATPTDFGG